MKDANRDGLGVWRGGYNGWGKVVGPSYGSITKFKRPTPAEAKPYLYHYVFCPHNQLYIKPCTKCGRDKQSCVWHQQMLQRQQNQHNRI